MSGNFDRGGSWSASGWIGRAMIWVTVLLATAVVGAGAVYGYARYRVPLASAPADSTKASAESAPLVDETPGQPFNLVLVGSDSRGFAADQATRLKFGDTSAVAGQRSDTLMVVHIDPAARTAQVLSIHRDLYVPISGTHRSGKINSALDSGPAALLNTLRDDLGIAASHFIEVDFASFQKVIDAIGPVPFYFPTPVRDAYTGLAVAQAGCSSLNGADALALVRSRHLEYLEDGRWREDLTDDRGRIVRQQAFLRRVLQLAVAHGLTNPVTLNRLIGAIAPSVTVDSGFETSEMGRVGRRFASSGPSAVSWFVLPVLDAKVNGEDVERLDQPAADGVLAVFGGRAREPLASTRPERSSHRADRVDPGGLASLPVDLTVRITGSLSAPAAAELAREDLLGIGITPTVALVDGPPPLQMTVSAPPQLQAEAAALARLVPGATTAIDADLNGTVVVAVGATWPGLANRPKNPGSAGSPPPPTSTTPTTVPAKGTDDHIACP